MSGPQLSQMTLGLVMCAQALDRIDGCEHAVYACSSENAVLKPFNVPLDVRAGKIGAIGRSQVTGRSDVHGRRDRAGR